MDKFIIEGGHELSGTVQISGAKNAALPLMAATLLWPGNYKLSRMPALKDTATFAKVLETTGAVVSLEADVMRIDTRNCDNAEAPYELVKQMRASFYVLGPLLARFGRCKVSMPGGCNWGPRPIDLHLKVMEALGAQIELQSGYIIATGSLTGANYTFPISSVGATGNGLMAAVLADGVTVLGNAAIEPEIVGLGEFLNRLGARIEGLGTRTLTITGVDELQAADETVIPDRIEAGTFLIAAAMIGREVTISDCDPAHLGSVIDALKAAGVPVEVTGSAITVSRPGAIAPVDITTAPYPGYPTDLQAQWIALMTLAEGPSTVRDEVYHDRFAHVPELTRLGARISLEGNAAHISAPTPLIAAPVMSTDIRASAAIVLAALVADGTTEISRVYHIDRGYEAIEKKLARLGAAISRVRDSA
ncbi:MAG: UDP-N-acetylglucosamine 1-carboxyvinyltransferase [Candidatus Marinimicrobia bacterium]|nr:UDP-N-acetylglucosamine 1-carboxyvinyltransferase [Candidatus Neomarinimicrobiota bacterium]